MRRGEIVDYTLKGAIDTEDPDGIIRAKPALVTRPAIVIEVHDNGTADLYVFAESWELPDGWPIVRGVSTGEAPADEAKARVLDESRQKIAEGEPVVGTFSVRATDVKLAEPVEVKR